MWVSESGPNCMTRPAPRSFSVRDLRSSRVMMVTSTWVLVTPGTAATAVRTSRSMESAAGHPMIVSLMPIVAAPSAATAMEPTMSRSVMGLRISGSMTRVRARWTSCSRWLGVSTSSTSGSASAGRSGSVNPISILVGVVLVQFVEKGTEFCADEVLARDILHRQPQGDHLAGQVFGVVEVALRALAVLLHLHPVAVVLPVLREQDHRRRVRRLQRQDEGEQRIVQRPRVELRLDRDRKSTRLNSSHVRISYAVFCLKKKKKTKYHTTRRHL